VERGTRQVQAGELIMLPLVLREALGLDIELAELVGGHGQVELTQESTLKADDVRLLLAGRGREVAVRRLRTSRTAPGETERWDLSRPLELRNRNGSRRLVDLLIISYVVNFKAERKAAKQLGVTRYVVALASWLTWNRSLSDERDIRVDDRAEPGVSPRTRHAIRGHVTRSLRSSAPRSNPPRRSSRATLILLSSFAVCPE